MIVVPEPVMAPVMLPVIVPIVQLKLQGTFAVNVIFGPVPLQIVAVGAFVTTGIGITVTVALLFVKPLLEKQPLASVTDISV